VLGRELAAEHVQCAREALQRAQALPDVAAAETARAEATREVIQALALDADHADARRLLVQLLLEVPERLPPTVEREMEEATRKTRSEAARWGAYALVAWAATIPLVAWFGVRDWLAFGTPAALTVVAALLAVWMRRNDATAPRHMLALASLVAALCGALSCWLGPFILAPVAGASTMIWFTLYTDRRWRWVLVVLGGLAMLVPFLLELVGWIPPSFRFEGGNLVLMPRALHLPPTGTTFALVYTSVTFCVLQPVLLGGMRDALSAAERKLFLHAWHLRQLAPEAGADRRA
jgi:serine/threonine-protein kinase